MRNPFFACGGIFALALFVPARAPAAVDSILANGSVTATTSITQTFRTSSDQRCGNPPASGAFSLTGPTMDTVDQPTCTFTSSDGQFTATASNHTTASVSESVSGGQHTFTFRFDGSASAHSN